MTKPALLLSIVAAIASSCYEERAEERTQIPFSGEWIPVSYSIGSEATQYPVVDCKDNVSSFSADLNEFMSGNLLVGIVTSCDGCPGFQGPYTWTSRCDQGTQYVGTLSTLDYGANISLKPEPLPDSTLQFNAVTSFPSGLWKLRYDIGDEYVTIHYKANRK